MHFYSIASFFEMNHIKDALQNTKLTKKTLHKSFGPHHTEPQSK